MDISLVLPHQARRSIHFGSIGKGVEGWRGLLAGMASAHPVPLQRPREWRRRVSLRARVNQDGQWDDGQILNLSSRGLMIQYARPLNVGDAIEIRHHDRALKAKVVWRRGFRVGLTCEGSIKVIDWLEAAVRQESGIAKKVVPIAAVRPRASVGGAMRSRDLGRVLEMAAIGALGIAAAVVAALTVSAFLTIAMDPVAVALPAR